MSSDQKSYCTDRYSSGFTGMGSEAMADAWFVDVAMVIGTATIEGRV
jgi:hypothetical protein